MEYVVPFKVTEVFVGSVTLATKVPSEFTEVTVCWLVKATVLEELSTSVTPNVLRLSTCGTEKLKPELDVCVELPPPPPPHSANMPETITIAITFAKRPRFLSFPPKIRRITWMRPEAALAC